LLHDRVALKTGVLEEPFVSADCMVHVVLPAFVNIISHIILLPHQSWHSAHIIIIFVPVGTATVHDTAELDIYCVSGNVCVKAIDVLHTVIAPVVDSTHCVPAHIVPPCTHILAHKSTSLFVLASKSVALVHAPLAHR